MKAKYHIWEFGNHINVKIKPEFLNQINNKIKSTYGSKQNLYDFLDLNESWDTFRNKLKPCFPNFIELSFLIQVCESVKISKYKLEKNILAYKTRRGNNYIHDPVLPVKKHPLIPMIISHNIGDGTVINPKNRIPYFGYRQFNSEQKLLYISRIESVFGKTNYAHNYLKLNKSTRSYSPTAISKILFNISKTDEKGFLSETARIPTWIFAENWKYQLAFLLGIIIDEGHVDSTLIIIRMKNKEIIKDIGKICSNLNYEHSIKSGKNKIYCLYILRSAIPTFLADYDEFINEFPCAQIGRKEFEIKSILNRKREITRIPGNSDKILNMLAGNEMSTKQIAKRLNMTRQGVRYHIKSLEKQEKIRLVKVVPEHTNIYTKCS